VFTKSARFYDAIYSFKDYAVEATRVRDLIRSRFPDARTLLDVACGTGLHLQYLRTDFECEGLDLDPELLAIARDRNEGLILHEADMVTFDLGKKFDAVTCLFSSIGYVGSVDRLNLALQTMAKHLSANGVLVVEPWLLPEAWEDGYVGAVFVDEPELKIARMDVSERRGRESFVRFHYQVATPAGVNHFTEDHTLFLFTHDEYIGAFRRAGLGVEHDAEGLMGRGLYVGTAVP
jgi:SAM-dependent methyltransferase